MCQGPFVLAKPPGGGRKRAVAGFRQREEQSVVHLPGQLLSRVDTRIRRFVQGTFRLTLDQAGKMGVTPRIVPTRKSVQVSIQRGEKRCRAASDYLLPTRFDFSSLHLEYRRAPCSHLCVYSYLWGYCVFLRYAGITGVGELLHRHRRGLAGGQVVVIEQPTKQKSNIN